MIVLAFFLLTWSFGKNLVIVSSESQPIESNAQLKNCPPEFKVCQNDGICLFTDGSILCRCQLPYTGVFCENKNKFCDLKPCKNGGTCIVKEGDETDGECLCAEGHFGKTCDFRDCNSDYCLYGSCLEIGGEKSCFCFNGYTGEKCDILLTK
ncbi:delta B [Brachionus plicatilis]|uniref:Delta B n=1 Tax=Brachionus plicatilis TaxID=10195 RepID=A0A3M7RXJ7_BRAPC|nr:delta B [Brachionus plicatilis]